MSKIRIHTRQESLLADTITPVGVYLKLRDRFANSFLLESSDYHGSENSFSYICCSPIASFKVQNDEVGIKMPSGETRKESVTNLKEQIVDFATSFKSEQEELGYIQSGLFGYFNYDAVRHFEAIDLKDTLDEIPLVHYSLFQFIIAFNHFKNECYVIESFVDEPNNSLFEEIIGLIQQKNLPGYSFSKSGKAESGITDDDYMEMVKKGIHHCNIGDVFQVVLSRRFEVLYQGDDFQVYRTLRSINPSPYLFYFDYGSHRIFGSSPEAQIVLKNGKAIIYPIAGTFKRTGNDQADVLLAEELKKDPKEDSEHVMLVDLARNDLSHSCENVQVETYKEIQYYSHVIHMVSKVSGDIKEGSNFMDIVANSFPAGTLSGAPKLRAMEIIDENEKDSRGYYGGAVGFMDFKGNFNHAIMIRSFLSKNNMLRFQAGAGVVSQSKPESELQEVYNKIGALQKAIEEAEKI